MDKFLFVNTCVRKDSRTLSLAKYILDKLNAEYTEVNLEKIDLHPLDGKSLEKRESFVMQGDFSDNMFNLAKEFSAADIIIIAAPYWDLAFPSLLKIYLEHVMVCGITFEYKKGTPYSLCNAKRLIYVTTAGGKIYRNYGFEYVKALAETFFNIPEVLCFKAEELDVRGADVKKIITKAKGEINI